MIQGVSEMRIGGTLMVITDYWAVPHQLSPVAEIIFKMM